MYFWRMHVIFSIAQNNKFYFHYTYRRIHWNLKDLNWRISDYPKTENICPYAQLQIQKKKSDLQLCPINFQMHLAQ